MCVRGRGREREGEGEGKSLSVTFAWIYFAAVQVVFANHWQFPPADNNKDYDQNESDQQDD